MVVDMQQSTDFYQKLLGFKVVVSVPDKNPFFVILKNGPVELMLYQQQEFVKEIPKFAKTPVGGSIALYLEVENIKPLFNQLKGKVNIIQQLHETLYGTREFSLEDVNGYVLMLAERK